MAIRRERVTLVLDDNFSDGMHRAAAAANRLGAEWTRRDATWEPIDWSEFD